MEHPSVTLELFYPSQRSKGLQSLSTPRQETPSQSNGKRQNTTTAKFGYICSSTHPRNDLDKRNLTNSKIISFGWSWNGRFRDGCILQFDIAQSLIESTECLISCPGVNSSANCRCDTTLPRISTRVSEQRGESRHAKTVNV